MKGEREKEGDAKNDRGNGTEMEWEKAKVPGREEGGERVRMNERMKGR
jgi:hypothetical protein